MNRRPSLFRHILIFVLAQLAWLSLVGLWIYWYVSNHIIISRVSETIPIRPISGPMNILTLIGGLVLLVGISVAMSLFFKNLNLQLNLTRLYDHFIANVTHELKSPLASIQLYLETLNERKVPPHRQKEFIALMSKDATRLNRLINSILDICRMEQKKIAHNFEVYDAQSLIEALIKEAREQYKLNDERLSKKGRLSCQVVADRNALLIVINNLVDNSIKYTDGPVEIEIDLSQTEKNVVIKFSDKGVGINPRHQKKVFQKFHRIHELNVPSVKGTGLGLYWVREIVRSHGGRVNVNSAGLNKGTSFTIELPIYPTSKRRYVERLLKITRKFRERMESQSRESDDA